MTVPTNLADAGRLSPYAVETRYPGFWDEITPTDVDEAIRIAEAMVAWARTMLGPAEQE